MQSPDESLDKLLAAVNQTLVETARFFKTSGSMHSRAQLKRVLPATNDEFHSALDSLSQRIFLAKAVYEKDYESVQKQKASQQLLASPEQSHTKQPALISQPLAPKPKPSPTPARKPATSVLKTNQPMTNASHDSVDPTTPVSSTANTHGRSVGTAAAAAKIPAIAPAAPTVPVAPPAPPALATPTTHQPVPSPLQNGSSRDLGAFGSLLPGLESYANSGGEDAIMSGQALGIETNQKSSGAADSEARNEMPSEDMAPTESNFDDLFVDDFADGENLLNNVEIGELDDSWFA